MSKIPSNFGSFGRDGYQSLSVSGSAQLGNNKIQFTLPISKGMTQVSFTCSKDGGALKKFTLNIGKNTPLYDQIGKENSEPAIKAILLKNIALLMGIHEATESKEVSAQFKEERCETILTGNKKAGVENLEGQIREVQKKFSGLAMQEKVEKIVAKALNPEAMYEAKAEIKKAKEENTLAFGGMEEKIKEMEKAKSPEEIKRIKEEVIQGAKKAEEGTQETDLEQKIEEKKKTISKVVEAFEQFEKDLDRVENEVEGIESDFDEGGITSRLGGLDESFKNIEKIFSDISQGDFLEIEGEDISARLGDLQPKAAELPQRRQASKTNLENLRKKFQDKKKIAEQKALQAKNLESAIAKRKQLIDGVVQEFNLFEEELNKVKDKVHSLEGDFDEVEIFSNLDFLDENRKELSANLLKNFPDIDGEGDERLQEQKEREKKLHERISGFELDIANIRIECVEKKLKKKVPEDFEANAELARSSKKDPRTEEERLKDEERLRFLQAATNLEEEMRKLEESLSKGKGGDGVEKIKDKLDQLIKGDSSGIEDELKRINEKIKSLEEKALREDLKSPLDQAGNEPFLNEEHQEGKVEKEYEENRVTTHEQFSRSSVSLGKEIRQFSEEVETFQEEVDSGEESRFVKLRNRCEILKEKCIDMKEQSPNLYNELNTNIDNFNQLIDVANLMEVDPKVKKLNLLDEDFNKVPFQEADINPVVGEELQGQEVFQEQRADIEGGRVKEQEAILNPVEENADLDLVQKFLEESLNECDDFIDAMIQLKITIGEKRELRGKAGINYEKQIEEYDRKCREFEKKIENKDYKEDIQMSIACSDLRLVLNGLKESYNSKIIQGDLLEVKEERRVELPLHRRIGVRRELIDCRKGFEEYKATLSEFYSDVRIAKGDNNCTYYSFGIGYLKFLSTNNEKEKFKELLVEALKYSPEGKVHGELSKINLEDPFPDFESYANDQEFMSDLVYIFRNRIADYVQEDIKIEKSLDGEKMISTEKLNLDLVRHRVSPLSRDEYIEQGFNVMLEKAREDIENFSVEIESQTFNVAKTLDLVFRMDFKHLRRFLQEEKEKVMFQLYNKNQGGDIREEDVRKGVYDSTFAKVLEIIENTSSNPAVDKALFQEIFANRKDDYSSFIDVILPLAEQTPALKSELLRNPNLPSDQIVKAYKDAHCIRCLKEIQPTNSLEEISRIIRTPGERPSDDLELDALSRAFNLPFIVFMKVNQGDGFVNKIRCYPFISEKKQEGQKRLEEDYDRDREKEKITSENIKNTITNGTFDLIETGGHTNLVFRKAIE